jgi:hypothetical protein
MMIALNDPFLEDAADQRTRLIIDMLARVIYGNRIADLLKTAGLSPGDYKIMQSAKIVWAEAVPDAARRGKLAKLIDRVRDEEPAFGPELERRWQDLAPPGREYAWYHDDDPYACLFVGLRASRAVIDRVELRKGLKRLAADDYRILVISGEPRSGKSHSWLLLEHLRDAGKLTGANRFVRVTTHTWSGEVTGEDLARSLVDKLGLDIRLTPSRELEDARVRKLLDLTVGHYPDDDVTRWILLDGLDRPGVQDSARDVAKRLITLVEEGELQRTRLIVTGLDLLGLTAGYSVQTEEIPPISETLVRSFFDAVATHLGCPIAAEELDGYVAEVFGPDGAPRDLREIERAVVDLARTRWAQEAHDGG